MSIYAGGHVGCVGAVEAHSALVTMFWFLVLVALVAGGLVDCCHVVLILLVVLIHPLSIVKGRVLDRYFSVTETVTFLLLKGLLMGYCVLYNS